MYILPTLKEFIENPMGKGSNAIPSRHLIRDDLRNRLRIMLTEKKKVMKLAIYRDKDDYYFHFLIPSESERENTYDVILHFFVSEDYPAAAEERTLNNYRLRFFSNSPSFTYTYLYAFELAGFFISEFKDKFKEETLDNPPVTRNPGEVISYEKTIFFACIHLLNNNKYLNKMIIDPMSKPYNEAYMKRHVRSSSKVELEIKKEMQRLSREKEEQERKEKSKARAISRQQNDPHRKEKVQPIGKVNRVKKITARGSSKSKIRPR